MAFVMAVDDDPEVLATLGRVLKREKFDVELVSSGMEALERLETKEPDLLILDIIMPLMDGIAVCEQLRRNPRFISLPILFLTAKGSTDDVVRGLDAGADDYVVKPFELTELRARIRALLRRGIRSTDNETSILQIGDLRLDSNTHQVAVGEKAQQLTSTEHRLLRYLMENSDQVLSLSKLLEDVWEYPPNTGDPDLVRAHIRNLRVKIEKGHDKKFIRTIHGVGYMIATPTN